MLGAEAVERLRMRIWKTRPDVETGARCTAAAEKKMRILIINQIQFSQRIIEMLEKKGRYERKEQDDIYCTVLYCA